MSPAALTPDLARTAAAAGGVELEVLEAAVAMALDGGPDELAPGWWQWGSCREMDVAELFPTRGARVDELVARRRSRNRRQAIESALADKLQRRARARLARESAKVNIREEKRLADEGLGEDFASWPDY